MDGGFSGPDFAAHVAELKPDLAVEVVKRCDTTVGFKVLPKRWAVEGTVGWLMHCRRPARDYERLSESVAVWIHVARICNRLRGLAKSLEFHEFPYGL